MLKTSILGLVLIGWWYALDSNGVVIGGKNGPQPTLAEFGAAQILEGPHPRILMKTLGTATDDLRVSRWRWNGSAFEVRPLADIKADRKKKLKPQWVQALRCWKLAQQMDSVDADAYTTAELDALKQRYLDLKAKE